MHVCAYLADCLTLSLSQSINQDIADIIKANVIIVVLVVVFRASFSISIKVVIIRIIITQLHARKNLIIVEKRAANQRMLSCVYQRASEEEGLGAERIKLLCTA
jgi:hypothetical protein